MGKKFFKFKADEAEKAEEPAPEPKPQKPQAGKRQFKASDSGFYQGGEVAAPYEAPQQPDGGRDSGFYSVQDPQLDDMVNRQLQRGDETAQRFNSTTISMETIEGVDDGYLEKLAEQTGLRVVNLNEFARPSKEALRVLTADQAKRMTAVPAGEREDGVLMIAIADPSNTTITDDLNAIITREIEIVIAPSSEIKERIEQLYGMGDERLEDMVEKADTSGETEIQHTQQMEVDLSDMDALANAPPVIKLVNVLLLKAIKERASDVHIEPFPNLVRIRYRVDGVLREIPSPPRSMFLGLISRIKVLASMDISESRLPQDGRMKLTLEGREIDLRVSAMPTAHGEAIVMRVLDKNMMMIGISQIGMTQEMLTRFLKHVSRPNGIVLVTGPTGSGKTTTLYAALAEVKDPGEKFITVEDPVEYELGGIVQVNINDGVGLTFSKCLRAILRQDPDTILVGEIRDVETAQIAIQASLTGHLVFSTLHTNSASATITRLVDMGVQPFLITSSVSAVIGQRLVRTICPSCRKRYVPTKEDLDEFDLKPEDTQDKIFYVGEGCHECGHTGYKGRMGLFELLEITDEIRDLILDQASTDEIQENARKAGMLTMRQDGWMKICLGLTTFEEVGRETPRDVATEAYKGEAPEGEGEEPSADAAAKVNGPAPQGAPGAAATPTPAGALEGEAAARILQRISQRSR